ncbi:MAG: hypothetical protein KC519_13470 [Anaerolineae bacterium]|nr:hypothetical protein [Anaerolineae bacterium]
MSGLVLSYVLYALTLWLGMALIRRGGTTKWGLSLTGLGLVAYAISLALPRLALEAPGTDIAPLTAALLPLPGIFWCLAAVHLLQEDAPISRRLQPFTPYVLVGAVLGAFGIAIVSSGGATWVISLALALSILAQVVALLLVGHVYRSSAQKRPWSAILVVCLFFGLSTGWLLLQTTNLIDSNSELALAALGFDLLLLGWAVAWLDAFEEGETLPPDLQRSFAASVVAVALIAGQVLLVMLRSVSDSAESWRSAMMLLLHGVTAAAIAFQVFVTPLQKLFDRLVGDRVERKANDSLRDAADAFTRIDTRTNLAALDDETFARLTRRALSHMSSLSRLTTSPLTRLPIIEQRLTARGAHNNSLDRALELRTLLIESIERLKPVEDGSPGTSDAWRHFNAVYYPYVRGLKLFSRYHANDLSEGDRAMLDWFRSSVPERTLHNWQTAAARLIAQDLRERGD